MTSLIPEIRAALESELTQAHHRRVRYALQRALAQVLQALTFHEQHEGPV